MKNRIYTNKCALCTRYARKAKKLYRVALDGTRYYIWGMMYYKNIECTEGGMFAADEVIRKDGIRRWGNIYVNCIVVDGVLDIDNKIVTYNK